MTKLLFCFLIASLPAYCQFTNATKLRGKSICAPLSPNNNDTLTWNSATLCFQTATAGSAVLTAPTFAVTPLATAIAQPVDGWQVQDGSGLSLANLPGVGTSNAITCGAAAVTWNTGLTLGRLTAGAHFNGTGDCTAANNTNFLPGASTAFSGAIWVTFEALNVLDFLMAQQSQAAGNPGWSLSKTDNSGDVNVIRFVMQSNASGVLDVEAYTNQAMITGRLYHLAFTTDGTHSCAGTKVYIDGYQTASACVINTMGSTMTPATNITLGTWSGANLRHTGYLAGARVFTGVLTPTQVQALYNAGPMVDTVPVATRTAKVVYASSFATMDMTFATTQPRYTAGTCTDNSAKLTAVAATASAASPLDLIIDGASCISYLLIPPAGNITIEGTGWSSGLGMIAGSNHSAISNGFGFYPTGTAPSQGQNVVLRNLKIDGNRGVFPNGNATAGDARGQPQIPAVDISNVSNLLLDHVSIYDSPIYSFVGANVSQGRFQRMRIEVPTPASEVNTDGIHLNGPCDHIMITNSYFRSGDDSIALNLPETYGGNCTDVQVMDNQIDGSAQAMRVYSCLAGSGTCYTAGNILVSGMTGTVINNAFNLGAGVTNGAKSADAIKSIRFSGITMAGTVGGSYLWNISDPIGEMIVDNSSWFAPIGSTVLTQFNYANSTVVHSLQFNNFKVYRNASGNAAPPLVSVANSARINTLTVNNFAVEDLNGSAYGALASVVDIPAGGAVGVLKVPFSDSTHVTRFASTGSYARVTSVLGVIPGALTVATLPSCNAASETATADINDATAPTYNAALTGGGAVHVPVYCNGTAWLSH